MDEADHVFASLATQQMGCGPTIACFYTGRGHPPACAPMLRLPEPEKGQEFNRLFADHLAAAIELNAAVHDGAVMLGRENSGCPYRILGWSFRLFPSVTPLVQEPNRGSAFNSCMAMSEVASIDCIYLVTQDIAYKFEGGSVRRL